MPSGLIGSMRLVRMDWNMAGFRALRTDPAMVADVSARAGRIAASAGPGYESSGGEVTGGRGRARAAAFTASYEAMLDNARNHSLVRSIDAGRG